MSNNLEFWQKQRTDSLRALEVAENKVKEEEAKEAMEKGMVRRKLDIHRVRRGEFTNAVQPTIQYYGRAAMLGVNGWNFSMDYGKQVFSRREDENDGGDTDKEVRQ